MIWQKLEQAEEHIDRMEAAVITYMGKAIMPKEPAQEEDRRKRQ
jgi:hypothetical protein